jgi:hypothetical protein
MGPSLSIWLWLVVAVECAMTLALAAVVVRVECVRPPGKLLRLSITQSRLALEERHLAAFQDRIHRLVH